MEDMVSVIVPVYNAEKYLSKCLESILSQSFSDLELILVNDGSVDGSPEICDSYARRDSRVILVNQEKSGVAAARNVGIRTAKGKLIVFVDSDDWLDTETLAECVTEFQRDTTLDCLLFAYKKEYPERSYQKHIFEKSIRFNNKEDFYRVVYRRLFGLTNDELVHPESLEYLCTCWGKVYRREMIADDCFVPIEEIGSCEDGLFNMDVLKKCTTALYVDKPYYHYRYSSGSLTLKYRAELATQWKRLFELMQKKLEENGLSEDFQQALNNRIALSVLGIGMNEIDNPDGGALKFIRYIRAYINSPNYRSAVATMRLSRLPFAWRMLMFCSKYRLAFGAVCILKAIQVIKSRLYSK